MKGALQNPLKKSHRKATYELPPLHLHALEAIEALRARARSQAVAAENRAGEAVDVHVDIPSDADSSGSSSDDSGPDSDDDNEHAHLDFDE